jgi:hypothetical protein
MQNGTQKRAVFFRAAKGAAPLFRYCPTYTGAEYELDVTSARLPACDEPFVAEP